jgi:hypothetical protein
MCRTVRATEAVPAAQLYRLLQEREAVKGGFVVELLDQQRVLRERAGAQKLQHVPEEPPVPVQVKVRAALCVG